MKTRGPDKKKGSLLCKLLDISQKEKEKGRQWSVIYLCQMCYNQLCRETKTELASINGRPFLMEYITSEAFTGERCLIHGGQWITS